MNILSLKYDRAIGLKAKISNMLSVLCINSRFIGKMCKFNKICKRKRTIKMLGILLKPLVLRKIAEVKDKYTKPISFCIGVFSNSYTLKSLVLKWKHHIRLIQKNIRDFIAIQRARKHALDILWNKLYIKQHIPPFIKQQFIGKYLNENIKQYLQFLKSIKNNENTTKANIKIENHLNSEIKKSLLMIYSRKNDFLVYIKQINKNIIQVKNLKDKANLKRNKLKPRKKNPS